MILACSKKARESVPLNYILLAIFTLMESCGAAEMSSELDVASVLISIGAFVVITGSLFLAALLTPI